jgi:hypothetical protein
MCDENYCDGWCEERCETHTPLVPSVCGCACVCGREEAPTYTYMSPAERAGARFGAQVAKRVLRATLPDTSPQDLLGWLFSPQGEEK